MESNSKIKNFILQNNAFRLHFVSCVFVEIGNWKITLKRIYYAKDLSKVVVMSHLYIRGMMINIPVKEKTMKMFLDGLASKSASK